MSLSISGNVYVSVTFVKQYGCFTLVHFSKKSGRLLSAGPEVLAFGTHCLQPILDCFIPAFKFKHEDSENIKTDCVNTVVVVFN